MNGETHLYLGRQYRLKYIEKIEKNVKIINGFIEVSAPSISHVESVLKNWYLKQARDKFSAIAQPIIEKFKKYGVEPEAIVLRAMPTRWGSCTPKGKILLNPELIKAPRGCIEYVITHELCHLIYRNHTQKFINLQSIEMPTWEKWKERLGRVMS